MFTGEKGKEVVFVSLKEMLEVTLSDYLEVLHFECSQTPGGTSKIECLNKCSWEVVKLMSSLKI